MQEIAFTFGGKVDSCDRHEYGKAIVTRNQLSESADASSPCGGLLKDLSHEFQVWMSHGDKLTQSPDGFMDIAYSGNSEHCVIANDQTKMFGIQFHPEVYMQKIQVYLNGIA